MCLCISFDKRNEELRKKIKSCGEQEVNPFCLPAILGISTVKATENVDKIYNENIKRAFKLALQR